MSSHLLLTAVCTLAITHPLWGADDPLQAKVTQLCRDYIEGFGSPSTSLVYHARLNGPRGIDVL
ncbi:MAG: hypothetical protein PVH68_13305, partial [Armatimonadota bacterium]